MINLKNKICLVTGSNGHIGRSICKKLKYHGATVLETDIKNIKKNKNKNFFIKADMANEKDINKLFKDISNNFKKIDILVNNASYVATSEKNKKMLYNKKYLEINLNGSVNLIEKLLPLLKKSKSASIINIGSIYGFLAYDKNLYLGTKMITPIAYGISKGALIQSTKLLASKLAPKIRVNSISPGGVFRNQPTKFVKKYINKTLLKRMAKEEDVSNAILFLSSELSDYITGQNLIVDGGYSLT
jgi:NAD(P)-dependent dehydrogenase (short-subunit alcohol dehydrogenase family)|tara:strand:+ start:269 stop:1000 length:732 start_codon:yes stop_codon:yes gene_type:complete